MIGPMKQPEPRQASDEALDELARTVTLATAALDHPPISDDEVVRLCDEVLSGCTNKTSDGDRD